jgi:hypothetical protein
MLRLIGLTLIGATLFSQSSTVQSANGWRVWVKTSPCSGRGDWVTVAKDNPTGQGNTIYQSADLIQASVRCKVAGITGCSFGDAQAEAASLRPSPAFLNYCCKDYSVAVNSRTQEMAVVKGSTVSPGWTVARQGLCCEDAATIAGKPATSCATGTGLVTQVDRGWRVWVKTSPCSGRFDWIAVAKDNPTVQGGSAVYQSADLIQSSLRCRLPGSPGCTLAQAKAEAAALRPSAAYANYCCKDYSVVRNNSTQDLAVQRGWSGASGWTVVRQGLCCDEASALAGKPNAACDSRVTQSFIGCFRDSPDLDLNGSLQRSASNTPQRCIESCRQKGFAFAAVQNGGSCLCGDSYGRFGAATNCDMRCTGDPDQFCGGHSANMIFSTAIVNPPSTPTAPAARTPGKATTTRDRTPKKE